MSSNDSVARWERQWAHLIARIPPNHAAARSRLLLAETNVQRAKREVADDPDAALIIAEQALINAADAFLARDGYSANSHVVRFVLAYEPSLSCPLASESGAAPQRTLPAGCSRPDARQSRP